MASQQVLIVAPVALFSVSAEGKTVEKGNCSCAIVALPLAKPKFSLVCYNEKRETLCVGSVTSSNEHSVQFQLSVGDYATFRDSNANKWSMMFLKSTTVEKFCAVLATCMYASSGQPTHATTVADLGAPKGEMRLGLSHRAKVKYTLFGIRQNNIGQTPGGLPIVDAVIETHGDRLYNFQPTQSAMAMLLEAKGFESSVAGMMEETTRVVVVPTDLPRNGKAPFPSYPAFVAVIHLERILQDDMPSAGEAPTVLSIAGPGGYDDEISLEPTTTTSVVAASEAKESRSYGAASSSSTVEAGKGTSGHVGAGVPPEHMMMIQKSAAQISTATTNTRDLHDRIISFQDDWKQVINRPKPSVLTPQALEKNVKSLIMDYDRVKDEISRRDELIKSLDDRNRDLQKRVDKAAMIAQQLLDEKTKTVETSSDTKLEKDRIIMKLQEEINRAANERDDVQRHLSTVKKLLEGSDVELRDIKGKADVHNVQTKGLVNKLDVAEDQVGEERSRRKGLEAKSAHMQEEIRNAEAELHLRTALLEETRRRADAERNHQAQIMEDERQRRAFEAQQLRTEIIEELQQRENSFQAERARTIDDFFKRGHSEGKELGRKEGRIEVESKVNELQLDAQRGRTELDSYKTELRQTTEEAMAENRRLESIVRQLKLQVDGATKKKAQNEFALQGLQLKVRNAEDNLFLSLTGVAHRLTHPAPSSELVKVLETIKQGNPPQLTFIQDLRNEELEESKNRRAEWIVAVLEGEYNKKLDYHYNFDVLPDLKVAAEDCAEAVRILWKERDESFAGELLMEQTQARYSVTSEEDAWFQSVIDFFAGLFDAQKSLLLEEEAVRTEISDEAEPFFNDLEEMRATEANERAAVEAEFDSIIEADVLVAEAEAYAEFSTELEKVVFMKVIEDQEVIIDEEQVCRQEIQIGQSDADDWVRVLWSHVVQCYVLESEETTVRLSELLELESEGFSVIRSEERGLWEAEERAMQAEADALRAKEEEEKRAEQEAEEARQEVIRKEEEAIEAERQAAEMAKLKVLLEKQREEEEEEARRQVEEEAAKKEAAKKERKQEKKDKKAKKRAAAFGSDDKDDDGDFTAPPPPPSKANVVPAPQQNDSDDDVTATKPAAKAPTGPPPTMFGASDDSDADVPPPIAPAAASSSTPTAAAAPKKVGGIFGDDTDDEEDEAPKKKPAPKAAAPKATPAKKAAPTNNLFGGGSSDDESNDNFSKPSAPPKPAAPKKSAVKKAPPKKSLFGDSDSD